MGRRLAVVAVLVMTTLTAGCAMGDDVSRSGQYAYGTEPSDLVGVWNSVNGPNVGLELKSDGSWMGASWPVNLNCSEGSARYVDDLDAGATVTGEWSVNPGDESASLPAVSLSVAGAVCSQKEAVGFLWRDHEGQVSVCIPVDPMLDPDNFTPGRTLMFARDGQDNSSDGACFG